jgi:hypothetical protein
MKDLKLSLQVPLGFNDGGADVVMRNCNARQQTKQDVVAI